MDDYAAGSRTRVAVWHPVAAVALASLAFILIKTARDAAFFEREDSLADLPIAFIWIGVASMPAALLHLRLMSRLGTRRAREVLLMGTALIFLSIAPWVSPRNAEFMRVLFVIVPVVFGAVFASVWLLAADLLESGGPATRRWAYARIGASSTAGAIVGGVLGRLLAPWVSEAALVGTGALALACTGWIAMRAHRRFSVPLDAGGAEAPRQRSPLHWGGLLSNRAIWILGAMSALAATAGLLIEFQFYAVVTRSGLARMDFFAEFYVWLSVASLVAQLSIAPLVQARLGLGGALLVLPVTLGFLTSALTVSATVVTRSILRVAEGGLKASIHRVAWEQTFLALGSEERNKAKVLVDGAAARVAEGLTAVGLYLWFASGGRPDGNLVAVLLAVVALWVVLVARARGWERPAPEEIDVAPQMPECCPVALSLGGERPR